MNGRIIKTLIGKDLLLFLRDKFYGFITIFSLLLYLGIFFILPKGVDETIEVGVFSPQISSPLARISQGGFTFRPFTNEKDLRHAIETKKVKMGISIPQGLPQSTVPEKKSTIILYLPSDIADEMKDLLKTMVVETLYKISGNDIPGNHKEEILGPDMVGKQIPFRKRLVPLLILMLIVTGTLGLANFITLEVERGTYQALSVTPLTVTDFFLGKSITGLILAFSQALFVLAITGSFDQHYLLIVTTVLLGSLMAIGTAFFIASISKDMMAVMAWGTIMIMAFLIPAFTIMFPGQISIWIKAIPSYFMVDILNRVINFDVGWGGNINSLLFLTGFCIFSMTLGILSMQRKVKCV